MNHQDIKDLFDAAVDGVCSNISDYSVHPDTDFTRNRIIPPQQVISFLVSQGSSSTRVEMFDFWAGGGPMPTASALSQQRAKLRPEALEEVLNRFNSSVMEQAPPAFSDPHYRFLAADGSTCTYFSTPSFSPDGYYCSPGSSARGVYSMHINAFWDLDAHVYTDALIQPVHAKNEYGAFCDIVDRHPILEGRKNVYIGDRGYCSYNNMAHVVSRDQYFLFRTKDIDAKGLVGNFDFPEGESFDIDVRVTLIRSHSKKIQADPESYIRFIDKKTSFDYIEYGSLDTYEISFRIVRFPISESTYECIVTNLPRDEFPPKRIKMLYFWRWGIMPIFNKCRQLLLDVCTTIGLSAVQTQISAFILSHIAVLGLPRCLHT